MVPAIPASLFGIAMKRKHDVNRDAALKLAEAGIAIFPCGADKKPVPGFKWQQFSSSDVDAVEMWWSQYPNALPAIDLAKSDLVVLDGDNHGGPDGREALGRLLLDQPDYNSPATPRYTTPNDGAHAYFTQNGHELTNARGDLPAGIDVRGAGGYTVCPYAVLPDGRRYHPAKKTPDLIDSYRAGTIPPIPEGVVALIEARKKHRQPSPESAQPIQGGIRERAYAQAALDNCTKELTAAAAGTRNELLNALAFRLGRMVARGWLQRSYVEANLIGAMHVNGYADEKGIRAIEATLRSGLDAGMADPHPDLAEQTKAGRRKQQDNNSSGESVARGSWKYHSGKSATAPRWLVKGILPETGVALIAGQWGTYKTTVALDVALCVMAGLPFAGRYRIKRRGAVLFIALEGATMLDSRLSTVAEHHGVAGALPFAWRSDCPALTNGGAADALYQLVEEASATLKTDFNLPVVIIVVDTMVTAAGYEAEGADNDAATTQKIFFALRQLAERTNTLVVGIDHFGKTVETGTRGSSAKERRRYRPCLAGRARAERRRQESPAGRTQAARCSLRFRVAVHRANHRGRPR
jgi:hypothetical protein